MRLLVTGGAGYIGSHFCKLATQTGHEVVVYDNFSTGHQKFCKFGPVVFGDLLDTDKLEQTLEEHRVEGIVHFAAKALVGESIEFPERYFKNNVEGTASLIKALKKHPVSTIVFSSSCATYGIAQTPKISEDHPQKPVNPYGESKLLGEKLFLADQASITNSLVMLRYFNVIGCDAEGELWEEHEPETHIIPNVLKAVNARREFQIFGNHFPTEDGTCVRDYIDVNDLGLVHLEAFKYAETHKNLISNVGHGNGYSNLMILKKCEKNWEREIPHVIGPQRIGDPPSLVAAADFFRTWCKVPFRTMDESLSSLRRYLK